MTFVADEICHVNENYVVQTNWERIIPLCGWLQQGGSSLFSSKWETVLPPSQFFIAPLENIHHPLRVAKNSNSSPSPSPSIEDFYSTWDLQLNSSPSRSKRRIRSVTRSKEGNRQILTHKLGSRRCRLPLSLWPVSYECGEDGFAKRRMMEKNCKICFLFFLFHGRLKWA